MGPVREYCCVQQCIHKCDVAGQNNNLYEPPCCCRGRGAVKGCSGPSLLLKLHQYVNLHTHTHTHIVSLHTWYALCFHTPGGAASLASLASAEWQQQQQHYITAPTASSLRPPVSWIRGGPHQQVLLPTHRTAPPHILTAAATAAVPADIMPAGSVWRAGSWPDAYTASG